VATFRWGVVGTGVVAQKFVLGLRSDPQMEAVVVASGARENAERFAHTFGVASVADDVDEVATRDDVDAIYVATPPANHRDHAVRCLRAGRPVLIEKPFASTAVDARAIAEAAGAADVFCMEAMWTRFLPLVRQLKSIVDRGLIGEPRLAWGSFGSNTETATAGSLTQPEAGGGALLHRGVYPLSLASHLLGGIDHIAGQTRVGAFGVDEDVVLTATHSGGAVSASISSLRTDTPNDLWVLGTDAVVHVAAPIYRPSRMTISPTRPRGPGARMLGRLDRWKEGALLQGAKQRADALPVDVTALRSRTSRRTVRCPYRGNGYHYEAAEVMRCVRSGGRESPVMPMGESVHLIALIESLAKGVTGPGRDR
jgi:predicted dehydrogenase